MASSYEPPLNFCLIGQDLQSMEGQAGKRTGTDAGGGSRVLVLSWWPFGADLRRSLRINFDNDRNEKRSDLFMR